MKRFIAILSAVMLAPCSLVMAQDEPTGNTTLLKYEPDIGERITVALTNAESAGEYWVGLQVAIPEDAERKKLNLPKDQPSDAGLIVQQVVPDAPGDTAGIKVGDLLMKLGDKPLKSLSDPLDAIRDAKDSKLKLTYVRDGKVFDVVIQPTKRPSDFGLYGPEPKKADSAPALTFTKPADEPKPTLETDAALKAALKWLADHENPTKPMNAGQTARLAFALAADPDLTGEYWIGLQVAVPDESQRKKLNVPSDQPQDQGLIVQQVVPGTPGDKAGVKTGDLLIKLGDKPLKSLADAVDAVRDTKDSKLLLTFIRDGKVFESVATPAKRLIGFSLYGPDHPKSEAGSSEPKAADALRKLDNIVKNRLGEFAPATDLQKIRAELAEIQQRIAIVNRQLAQFESSQANPDRERLTRQIAAMKKAAAELIEVGRTEDADRLKEEIRKLSEKMKALGQPGAGDAPPKRAFVAPQPTPLVVELDNRDAASATQRAMAFLQRAQTEVPAAVPPEVRRAMVIQRTEPDGPAVADLRKQIEDLRRELKELRDTVSKSKAERN
jgi:membrane-associated protease RseP (regulator of RpoE activity)